MSAVRVEMESALAAFKRKDTVAAVHTARDRADVERSAIVAAVVGQDKLDDVIGFLHPVILPDLRPHRHRAVHRDILPLPRAYRLVMVIRLQKVD